MKNRKVIPTWLSLLFLALLATSATLYVIFCIRNYAAYRLGFAVSALFFCITSVAALIYCFSGYGKNAAKFFQLFCLSDSIFNLSLLLCYTANEKHLIPILMAIAGFIVASVFGIAENLGKRKSYLLALAHILAASASLCDALASANPVISYASNLLLTVFFGVLVLAKYRDKTARGTK